MEHSNHVLCHVESRGGDADFVPFDPPASCYHYRDPILYAEIRNIIAKLEIRNVAQFLKHYLCYSVQIDGSADKQQIDSKFITGVTTDGENANTGKNPCFWKLLKEYIGRDILTTGASAIGLIWHLHQFRHKSLNSQ